MVVLFPLKVLYFPINLYSENWLRYTLQISFSTSLFLLSSLQLNLMISKQFFILSPSTKHGYVSWATDMCWIRIRHGYISDTSWICIQQVSGKKKSNTWADMYWAKMDMFWPTPAPSLNSPDIPVYISAAASWVRPPLTRRPSPCGTASSAAGKGEERKYRMGTG
jgi:hypothetical protein